MKIKTVLSVIEKYGMLEKDDTVVVGFSGGADSVSLLYVLIQLKNEFNLNLIGAHVNHGIRGEEADRDENFCREFCLKYGIRFESLKVNVPLLASENSMSEEEYGRKVRYDFFSSLAGESGKIATAHNLNDSVETLLFNLARGTSGKGACSIPAVRGNIIRPLIETPREEIESFCEENSLQYVTDSTNFENEYSRNKIRNVVIPALKEINPSAVYAVARYIESAKQDEELLSAITEENYKSCFADGKLSEDKLSGLASGMKRRIVAKFLSANTKSDVSAKNIDDIVSLIGTDKSVNSAGGIKIQSRGGFLSVVNGDEESIVPWQIEITKKNKCLDFPYGTVEVKILNIKDLQILNKENIDNYIDCDKISNALCLRNRVSGDEITLRKRNVTKSLKKLFNEDGVPLSERNKLAVLSDGESVVWVQNYGTSKNFCIDKDSKNIMKIEILN